MVTFPHTPTTPVWKPLHLFLLCWMPDTCSQSVSPPCPGWDQSHREISVLHSPQLVSFASHPSGMIGAEGSDLGWAWSLVEKTELSHMLFICQASSWCLGRQAEDIPLFSPPAPAEIFWEVYLAGGSSLDCPSVNLHCHCCKLELPRRCKRSSQKYPAAVQAQKGRELLFSP